MNSFWSEAYGCQADDGYELLKTLLQARGELLGVEAAHFLGCDLQAVQPLLQRLVEEGLAVAAGPGSAGVYRWQEPAQHPE